MQTLALLIVIACIVFALIAFGGWCVDLMNGRHD